MIENGTLGIVFGLLSLWRTDWSDPFAQGTATPALAYSIGQTYEDGSEISQEFRLSYFTDKTIGPVQLMWDASLTTRGGLYVGTGSRMEFPFQIGTIPAYIGMSAIVGLWNPSNDVDLGFPIEFRTDLEFGVEVWDSTTLSIVTDHRSHARLSKLTGGGNFRNSGMESIALRLTRRF